MMRPIHTVTASANAIERYSSSELDLHNQVQEQDQLNARLQKMTR